jgi:carbamoyltransferase
MVLAPGMPMRKQHSYVLGLNTYDHDASACLLRDGATAKERITREKHASGFYKEVIDYCLDVKHQEVPTPLGGN